MGKPRHKLYAAVDESETPPDALAPNQSLARVVKAEGNNLFSCSLPGGGAQPRTVVAELAARFRNTIWIKNGGYVLIELWDVEDAKSAAKVQGEIINVVRDERAWRKQKYWPAEFAKSTYDEDEDEEESNVGKLPPTESDED